MRAVPTPSTLIGAIGAGEQARRIKNQEQISAVLQEEGILMVAFYEMLNGIAWASLFMSVKWTTRFKSEAPPAELEASGSPLKGGEYVGKAPLGLN